MIRALGVFCGSRNGSLDGYAEGVARLGATLLERGITLVYGGGAVGLMGRLADVILTGGGRVTGVIPSWMARPGIVHEGLTDLCLVETMHERKAKMYGLADAFIALPGGFGTLEELFEVATWTQLGLHAKPVGLLDVEGYFTPLRDWLDRAVRDDFILPAMREIVACEEDPARLLDRLGRFRPPRSFIDSSAADP